MKRKSVIGTLKTVRRNFKKKFLRTRRQKMETEKPTILRAHHLINLCIHAFVCRDGKLEVRVETADVYGYVFEAKIAKTRDHGADMFALRFYGLESNKVYTSEFVLNTLKGKGIPKYSWLYNFLNNKGFLTEIPKA